jgi:uncharacterized membrane protein HdeD (DUF308 family)
MDKGTGSRKAWEYVDFELEIGEGGPRTYPVTVRSPAGEAHEEMRFPFAEWELENKLLTVENTLLRSGETRRRIPSQEEQPVQEFGRSLLQALLVGEVRTRYAMSLLEARRQNKGLRLKLRIHPPNLARLPWEFLYDPDRDEYLSLSSKTPLVRYLDLHQPVEQLPVSPPLRILGMVSSPRDLPVLDVEYEKGLVEEAIKGLRTSSLIEMTWLEGQTWSDLQEAMWGGPWHVFHFIGHGGFDEASQEGAIALADESGRKHLLGARNLARLLDDHYSLRLALLNSCEGARSSVRDAFSSTAATLVRRGVPAVVAMQYEITDRAAIAFARVFYRAVADGLPVDAAVAAGRTAVSMDSALEWGTPVLYMRSPDGRIFDMTASAPRTQPTAETEDRQEYDSLRRYREGVESAWADGKLQSNEVQRLKDLAVELGLNRSAAADIEREVMGDTIEAIFERQEQAARQKERWKELDELYAQARRSHRTRNWQAVVDVFDQIHTIDSDFSDPEGILVSAREALEAQELARRVATLYAEGQRHIDAREWQLALELFEEVQRLKPGYRQTGEMLARIRQVQSPGRTEQPEASEGSSQQMTGRTSDQAEQLQPGDFAETQPRTVLPAGAGHWWALALRGLVALLFGLVVLFWPGLVLAVLTILFGLYAVVDGAITFWPALGSSDQSPRRWLPLAEGAVGIIAGLIALLWPGLTIDGLVYVIVGWAVVTGTLRILTAILLRAEVETGGLLAGSGALLVLLGILFAALAGADVPFLATLVGAFAVVFGILLLITAVRVRR